MFYWICEIIGRFKLRTGKKYIKQVLILYFIMAVYVNFTPMNKYLSKKLADYFVFGIAFGGMGICKG